MASLGSILSSFNNAPKIPYENKHINSLENAVVDATHYNGWFIEENVRFMLSSVGSSLSKKNITQWLEPYKLDNINQDINTVGVVMAGNIPIVGFHDLLSVLISGNRILAKLSSDDDKLLPIIAEILIDIEPEFKDMISFTSNQLKEFDAIIATGSNNTSRYFEYYFGKYPNIIRGNRNGVAVLTGDETEAELEGIVQDITMYFGLGCRNVSHLFVKKDYDFSSLLKIVETKEKINLNHKYFNNYEYNKAIYLVNSTPHYDSGNMLLVEDRNFSTPVSVLSYEYFTSLDEVNSVLENNREKIQCVISKEDEIAGSLLPGNSQSPELWDYADGVDTMEFLSKL